VEVGRSSLVASAALRACQSRNSVTKSSRLKRKGEQGKREVRESDEQYRAEAAGKE
jgi:hypothetical protein